MTLILVVLVVALAILVIALGVMLGIERIRGKQAPPPRTRRILFPFVGQALSAPALDAALRIANAEEATLVPVFLCRVSLDLPLESTPLPRQSGVAIPLQEAIEQRAAEFDVPVDARIERGRSYRHALRQTIAHERYDRLVIAAAGDGAPGFDADEVAWLLDHAPGEIVVVRPGADRPALPPRRPRRSRVTREYERAASQ